ncbi:MAG: undecaprenyldiphospho-muramoylpentapeptide beta-N-acetylglucosaminyltransferase [Deltaproteobacteria bacterium]|nr:undecaprenyldiphospho-muramoylpentapeptide beta-N-acetylglucosaminyltransferase [Deltaproteobacteria bacterium]
MFAGGGTGGHLMPALAVAQALGRLAPDTRIHFLGTSAGIEAERVPRAGYDFHAVRGGQVKRVGLIRSIAGLFSAALGVAGAWSVLSRVRPAVVVAVGGYASFAGGVAARLRRIPLVVLEQNAIPGRVNRFLSRFADLVVIGFEEARAYLKGRVERLGNPVRTDLIERYEEQRAAQDARGVFVFGGSQGARRLNDAAVELASVGVEISKHQTGERELGRVLAAYAKLGLDANAEAFVDDMASAYARARVVLCRAGATSIAELTALGLPSVLVPYPFAADDHQRANARALEREGAAVVVDDGDASGAHLRSVLNGLLDDPVHLDAMGDAAKRLGRPNAAVDVARRILSVGGAA